MRKWKLPKMNGPRIKPLLLHSKDMKVIYLQWSEVSSGLIIKRRTGIGFSHQTGGYSCTASLQEGILIPLVIPQKMMEKLNEIFIGKYKGWCNKGIQEEDADFLDSLFQEFRFPVRVDRTLLQNSMEAWIHVDIVQIDEKSDEQFHGLVEFSGEKAVFIFENSD